MQQSSEDPKAIKTEIVADSDMVVTSMKNEENIMGYAESLPIKTEFKYYNTEETFKHNFVGHESPNLFEIPEHFVTTKYEIQSEDMKEIRPQYFEQGANLPDITVVDGPSGDSKTTFQINCNINSKKLEKQWQKMEVDQLRASSLDNNLKQQGKETSLICSHCDYSTNCRSTFASHMLLHGKREIRRGCYECKVCKKQFQMQVSLDDHIIKNHQDYNHLVSSKVYKCPKCDYKTTRTIMLKRHTVYVHSENYEKHLCTCCGKHFKKKRGLDNHTIKKHPNLIDLGSSKVYNCQNCGYQTTIKSDLIRHMMKMHLEYSERHSCTHCEQHFQTRILLDEHIVKNHQNFTEKNHGCPTCDFKTTTKANLNIHILRVHSRDSKKQPCIRCEKYFTTKLALDDHIIKRHKNFIDLVSSKIHNCQTCDYRTTKLRSLRQHTFKIHQGN